MLDPTAEQVLALGRSAGGRPFEDGTAEEARAAYDAAFPALQGPLEAVSETRELRIEGPGGPIPLRLHRGHGAPAEAAPAILYCHGGGWVIGGLDSHDDICRWFANLAKAVVVCPDYRLAPEHPFPAGLEDCLATLRALAERPAAFGIDAARIAVAGDSAGGNLAAVLALHGRDGRAPHVAVQLLIYPNTDAGQTADSYRRFADGFGLTARTMRWFRDQYVRSAADIEDWRVSPLRAASLAGSPPAYLALAGCDILHDEGEAYAERLHAEGVSTQIGRRAGQIHGYVSAGRFVPAARETVAEAVEAWRRFDGR
ncbi:alpha/beta hydrolase [Aureimonas leprariae]|nr:alpha/beta hydrolase [Aureimonas leprariae]